VEEDTLQPSWESTQTLTLLVDQEITFSCYDRDNDISGNDKIFEKTVQITPEDVRRGSVELTNDRGFSLTLKLRPQLQ